MFDLSLLICRLKLCLTYEKGSANERREKKVSLSNFHFLSRVQPVLSKESTAGNRPPGKFGGVADTDCERLTEFIPYRTGRPYTFRVEVSFHFVPFTSPL